MKKKIGLLLLGFIPLLAAAQAAPMTLKECLDYAVANNASLQKDRLGMQSAAESRREVVGSLLPQLNASGSLTRNFQKTTVAMPNFMNSMLPAAMQDPDAPKYMAVAMGMDLSANWGLSLSQQVLNFSLFSAVEIAKAAEEMAETGLTMDRNDVVAQTATLYYNAQVLAHALTAFDESLALMDRTAAVMDANVQNGIVRKVDADRISVTKMNLETEKMAMEQALDVQKNLLKLQMGFPMTDDIELMPMDIDEIERTLTEEPLTPFELSQQLPFQMLKQQQGLLQLQRKAAVSEVLPALSLSANYSNNYMGDHFYGETYHHFPVSMVSLNMRMPLFAGMSKRAKIKKAALEMDKALEDERMLTQSLTMGYSNAMRQLHQNRATIESQRRNRELAEEVLTVTENNYNEGIAPLSDVLNATTSLIQAQMNYVNALNSCMKAYIDLKKADGSIADLYPADGTAAGR